MRSVIKNICCALIFGYILIEFQDWLKTDYLTCVFFKNSLVPLLVALVAINSATLGIILSKIRDMLDKSNTDKDYFANTRKEMALSINEQIAIIVLTILWLMMRDADFIKGYARYIDILIAGGFIYAIYILWDTAKCVFQLLDFKSTNGQG